MAIRPLVVSDGSPQREYWPACQHQVDVGPPLPSRTRRLTAEGWQGQFDDALGELSPARDSQQHFVFHHLAPHRRDRLEPAEQRALLSNDG
jgi:hypothetical protein